MSLDAAVAAIAAHENPGVDAAALLEELDAIAKGTRMPVGIPLSEQVARLNLRLFQDLGFQGAVDDYDRPENCHLDYVLREGRGLPILLSVVYIEVARRLEVPMVGIGFPGHFLVGPSDADPRFVVDPFNQGRVLTEETLRDQLARIAKRRPTPAQLEAALKPVDDVYILLRINNNLKGAHLRNSDVAGAARATERMLALMPHLAGEQRELALMRVHLGQREVAIEGLEVYLKAWPTAPEASELRDLVASLSEAAGEEGEHE